MLKTAIKVAVATGIVAGTVAAVRKYKLVERGAKLADTAVDKLATGAEAAVAKSVVLADKVLTLIDEKTGGNTGGLFAKDDTPDTEGMREAEESLRRPTGVGFGNVTGADHDGQGAGLR